MLARRNNNEHLGTISYYPADGILFSICYYLQPYYFNRLQLSARHYKMPAQQQAVDVSGKPTMTLKRIFILTFILTILGLVIYYFYPIEKIPGNIIIDKIVVLKAKHKLLAYSKGQLVVTYKIAIGKNPIGDKEYEGDQRTPEGSYIINSKNPNSDFHKNLGVSYPNQEDIKKAKLLVKPTGGDIKLHGLKNGQGYIGKFLRWKDWTNGCIAMTNDEIDELYNHTPIGTTIEIKQ